MLWFWPALEPWLKTQGGVRNTIRCCSIPAVRLGVEVERLRNPQAFGSVAQVSLMLSGRGVKRPMSASLAAVSRLAVGARPTGTDRSVGESFRPDG